MTYSPPWAKPPTPSAQPAINFLKGIGGPTTATVHNQPDTAESIRNGVRASIQSPSQAGRDLPTHGSRHSLEPPEWLDDVAKEEFVRVGVLLSKTLQDLDLSVLADYAQAYSDCISLQEEVDNEGIKLMGPKGGYYLNPTYNALINRRNALARLRSDLGLTPKARKEKVNKPSTNSLRETLGR